MNKTEVFIEKARLKHGDTYDYSKVEYISCDKKVIIICTNHGEFLQTPYHHINRGNGCKKCGDVLRGHNRRSNTKTFTENAILLHGDKYKYDNVNYITNYIPVIIICKIHGEFLQKPLDHLLGKQCKKCSKVYSPTTIEFIERSKQIHGDKYDYTKTYYDKCDVPVIIFCNEHGEFKQTPSGHLSGSGCSKCSGKYQYSTDEYITQAITIHGHKYDYSKTIYVKSDIPIIIICKEHGEFTQTANSHLTGHGCKKCGIEKNTIKCRSTINDFIENAIKIHGDTYDYSRVIYVKTHDKVIIICKIHGEFVKTPHDHLSGSGCSKCSGKYQYSTDEYITQAITIHGHKYNYSKVTYEIANKKITIICKDHGEFEQTAGKHLSGQGCPFCINKTEGKLYETLKTVYPTITTQFKQEWCKNITYLPYDFCIPNLNIIIELDGAQHFKQVSNWQSPEDTFAIDKYKEQCANDNNYSMIRLLQEDVFYDKYDWCKELCDAIEDIKRGDDIVNIYLCKHNEYDQF